MVYKIDITKPLIYFKSGQFQNPAGWQHKMAYSNGDFEIFIGIKGQFHLQLDAETVAIGPGDICVVPPYVHYKGSQPCTEEVVFYWIHFFPQSRVETCNEMTFLEEVQPSHHTNAVYLPSFFHATSLEKFHIMMRQLLDIAHAGYCIVSASDYQTTLLTLELTEQYWHYCIARQKTISESSRRFSQILDWIRINIYQDLSVQVIAEHFAIHPDYMNRLFQKQFHMSTSKYINQQKIHAVKGLICARNLSIKEIADLMNFHDEKYLMRLFKKTEGVTITEYRNAFTSTYTNNSQIDPDIPRPQNLPGQTLPVSL